MPDNILLCCIICLNPDTDNRFNHLSSKKNGQVSIISMLENVIGKTVSNFFISEKIINKVLDFRLISPTNQLFCHK